jgi:hypothetical protein
MQTIYDQYIEYLQSKEKLQNSDICQKHHIIPKHTSFPNNQTVVCTSKEHTLAHYYRFLSFQQKVDLVAYQMRWNHKIEIKERVKLAVEINRINNTGFWNSEFQSKQGKKGGKKSGSLNTVSQFKARQKIGQLYGTQTGIKNQSPYLSKSLNCHIRWTYNLLSPAETETYVFWTSPLASAVQLCTYLQVSYPAANKLRDGGIRKLLKGQLKTYRGFAIDFIQLPNIELAIRSQAKGTPLEGSETTGGVKPP